MGTLLKDKIFISTRPEGQSDELAQLFSNEGATMIEMPLIKIQQAKLTEEEKTCFKQLPNFQWLILTSSNGVNWFFDDLQEIQGNKKLPKTIKIAVIGHKTEQVLNRFGYSADFINPGSTAEDFVETFLPIIQNEKTKPSVLLALGNLARTVIQDKINDVSKCTRINLYETIPAETLDKKTWELITGYRYDMLLFTSPSGIINFAKIAGKINLKNIRIACIGETTANAAIENNITPQVVAQNSTAAGLFESILNYYKNKKN